MWKDHVNHLQTIWKQYGNNLEITIWTQYATVYGNNMDIIWTQYGHHMETIWTSYGHNMDIIWTQYGHNMDTNMDTTCKQSANNLDTICNSMCRRLASQVTWDEMEHKSATKSKCPWHLGETAKRPKR